MNQQDREFFERLNLSPNWVKCKRCGQEYAEKGIIDGICFECVPTKFNIMLMGVDKHKSKINTFGDKVIPFILGFVFCAVIYLALFWR